MPTMKRPRPPATPAKSSFMRVSMPRSGAVAFVPVYCPSAGSSRRRFVPALTRGWYRSSMQSTGGRDTDRPERHISEVKKNPGVTVLVSLELRSGRSRCGISLGESSAKTERESRTAKGRRLCPCLAHWNATRPCSPFFEWGVQYPLTECSIECSPKTQLNCTTSSSKPCANASNDPRMLRPSENQRIASGQPRMAVAWKRRARSGKPPVPRVPKYLRAGSSRFKASPADAGATWVPEVAPKSAFPRCDSESGCDSLRLA